MVGEGTSPICTGRKKLAFFEGTLCSVLNVDPILLRPEGAGDVLTLEVKLHVHVIGDRYERDSAHLEYLSRSASCAKNPCP